MSESFRFHRIRGLVEGDLALSLSHRSLAEPPLHPDPRYDFSLVVAGNTGPAGEIQLRIASARKLHYQGHLAYEVYEEFRGHHYAARACRLLFPLAHSHGLKAVWISCEPGNMASRRTCELLGARYMGTARIPKHHLMYAEGLRYVRRYRVDLSKYP
jgi:predicted acetyltransferase